MVRIEAIGWRAHGALVASGGVASVLAPLSRSFYAEAAGELIWLGDPGALLHPRAVLASNVPAPAAGASLLIALDGITPWRPAPARIRCDVSTTGADILRAALTTLGRPRGLARLLLGDVHDDPVIVRAAPHVRALADACAHDDAGTAVDAVRPLLGLGDGLTPSGDDYVGGVLFARRVRGEIDRVWEAAIAHIVSDARVRTHPISARLLTDLAAGEGWAPLHDLASALATSDARTARLAVRRLTTLGDASGWNILAGFLGALSGST